MKTTVKVLIFLELGISTPLRHKAETLDTHIQVQVKLFRNFRKDVASSKISDDCMDHSNDLNPLIFPGFRHSPSQDKQQVEEFHQVANRHGTK